MSLIDIRKMEFENRGLPGPARHKLVGPVRDLLGISFFLFHLCICAYMVLGWVVPSTSALVFYLVFLPLVAMQWLVNRGSCIIANFETLLRTRRWRDPEAAREGRFILTVAFSLFGVNTSPAKIDVLSFGALFALWLLGFVHLSVLGDPALLSIFP
jgi:hypothetical protein